MKWIDVNDDLPPSKIRVLVSCYLSERIDFAVISDAYFVPSKGWFTYGYDEQIYEVTHWHFLFESPPKVYKGEEAILRSLADFQAACAKLDDIR
jgi:hypothetical protein